jgi:transcriptional regulator with GAF, ATPase, and Fis domain
MLRDASSSAQARSDTNELPPRAPPVPGAAEAESERKATRARPLDPGERARIEAVLRQERGLVRAAARVLGLHRTHLRRLIERGQVTTPRPDPSDAEHDDEPGPQGERA